MNHFRKDDRVKYTGPVINEPWDPEREGTVIGVSQRIDIKWDHGPLNYGQSAEGYSLVGDRTVMGSIPTDDDQPSYSTVHDIDEIAQQLLLSAEAIRGRIRKETTAAEAFGMGASAGTLLRTRRALLDLLADRNATKRALDHFKKAVVDAPHDHDCRTYDLKPSACNCWKSKESL